MKKTTLLVLFLSTLWGYSQVTNYTFSQTTGTYSEIFGGTILGNETTNTQRFVDPAVPLGGTIATGVGLPIGFNFTFNGFNYDRFAVCADGWISLGSSALGVNSTVSSPLVPLASTINMAPPELSAKIAALAKDLAAQTGSTLSFQTIGTAPSRVLVVQWKKYRKNSSTADNFNFQIRLNETLNTVDLVYGSFVSDATTNATYQLGLRADPATTASNFIARKSTTGWNNTIAATAPSDNVLMSNLLCPANGLTFTWTPPLCGGVKNLVVSSIATDGATLSWGAYSSDVNSYEYIVSKSSALPLLTDSGTPASSTTATVYGLDPSSVYNVYFRTICGTGISPWTLSGTFKTLCLDQTTFFENFDNYPANPTTVPDCWSFAGNGSISVISGSVTPMTVPNRLFMNASTGTVAYAIMPPVANLLKGDHRLRFTAYSPAGTNKPLDIGYFATPGDLNSFVVVQTVNLPGTAPTVAQTFMVAPGMISPGIKSLVFRSNGIPTSNAAYIDDVIYEPIPTCPDILPITLTGITDTSLKVVWDKGGSETEWQYVCLPSTVLNPNSVAPATTSGQGTSVVISGLNPNTSYKAWVRSQCSDTDFGAWIASPVFSTSCTPITQFVENFDSTSALPNCWTKIGTSGPVNPVGPVSGAPSGPNALTVYGISGNYNTLVLPALSNTSAGTNRLRFKAKSATANLNLQIGYLIDPADPNSFVPLQTFSPSTTAFSEYVMAFGTNVMSPYLAFRNTGTLPGSIYVDDVVWEPIPICTDITALVSTSVKSTSANIGWTAGGAENAWQFVFGNADVLNPSSLTPVDVSNPAATFSGLLPLTTYKIWARSKCDDGTLGNWVGPLVFTTSCSVSTSSFSENFDASTFLPACWSKIGSTGTVAINPTSSTSSPNALYLTSAPGVGAAVAAMPPANNASAGTNRLKFKVKSTVANATIEVGYLMNYADPTSFVLLNYYKPTQTTAFESVVMELGTAPATEYLAFRNPGTISSPIYIDDVAWEPIPSCPDISALVSTSVNSTSANISWNVGGVENTWQFVVGPAAIADPSSLTPMDVSNTTVTLTGLIPQTAYKLWVRSKCDSTNLGAWVGPLVFTTSCSSSNSFSENFDSSTSLPACWFKIGNGGTVAVNSVSSPSLPNALYLYSNPSIGIAIAAMPPVNIAGDGTHRLRFKVRSNVINAPIEIGYLMNYADPSSFVPLFNYQCSQNATFESVSFTPGFMPTEYLAFRNPGTIVSPIYIDDVAWETIPSCPDISALVYTNVNSTSASMSWTSGGSENSWQYVVGTAAITDPSSLMPVDVSNTTTTLSSLLPATAYKVWVRSKCSDTGLGAWVGPLVFTTSCSASNSSFWENFDASSSLPACWSKIGGNGTVSINPISSASEPNALYLNSSPVGAAVVAMPPLSNAGAGTNRLRFKVRAGVANASLDIGYLLNYADPNSFVVLKSYIPSQTTFESIVMELGTDPTTEYLAFRSPGIIPNPIYIDDVAWEPIPTAPPAATDQTFCNKATISDLIATGTAIKWYTAATGGEALDSSLSLSTGIYYASQILNNIESTTRTAVSITINITPVPTAVSQNFYTAATVADLTATGSNLQWYVASAGGSVLTDTNLTTGTYYVSQTINSCESERVAVDVTVGIAFCYGANVTDLTAKVTGTNIKWYSEATGGSARGTTALLTSTTYYYTETIDNVESARIPVDVTVYPKAKAGAISSSTTSVCAGGDITFTSTAYVGDAIQWQYTTDAPLSQTNTTPQTWSDVLGETALVYTKTNVSNEAGTKFYIRTQYISRSCTTAYSAVKAIMVNPLSIGGTVTGGGIICSGNGGTLKLTGQAGKIQWLSSNNGTDYEPVSLTTGTTYVPTGLLIDTWYKAQVTSGVCSADFSNPVKFEIGNAATVGVVSADTTLLCKGSSTTLNLSSDNYGTVFWEKSTDGVTWSSPINSATTLTTDPLLVSTYFRASTYIGTSATVNCFMAHSEPVLVNVIATPISKEITDNKIADKNNGTTSTKALACDNTDKILSVSSGYVGAIEWQWSSTLDLTTNKPIDFTPISGETSTSYTIGSGYRITGANYYRVRFYNECDAQDFSNAITVYYAGCSSFCKKTVTSDNIVAEEPFAVVAYPNPFNEGFNLSLTSASDAKVGIRMYDMLGKLLEQREVKPSEVPGLNIGKNYPTGIYIVVLTQEDETKTLRVIKQ